MFRQNRSIHGPVKPAAGPRLARGWPEAWEVAARTRRTMRELVRTNDVVKLSWLQALLADAGIEAVVLDGYTSVMEGSIGAIPRRLVVIEADFARALRVLEAAGEETSL